MKIGAGFIIYKIQNGKIKIFVLFKKNNQIDLPKGGHDDKYDNSIYDTAVRETYEECGIKINKNNIYLYKSSHEPFCKTFKNLTFFISKHDNTEPLIRTNPNTNVYEHIGFDWLFIEELLYSAPNYLLKPLLWAFKHIKNKESLHVNDKTNN